MGQVGTNEWSKVLSNDGMYLLKCLKLLSLFLDEEDAVPCSVLWRTGNVECSRHTFLTANTSISHILRLHFENRVNAIAFG